MRPASGTIFESDSVASKLRAQDTERQVEEYLKALENFDSARSEMEDSDFHAA